MHQVQKGRTNAETLHTYLKDKVTTKKHAKYLKQVAPYYIIV